jgi:hypothetical protein
MARAGNWRQSSLLEEVLTLTCLLREQLEGRLRGRGNRCETRALHKTFAQRLFFAHAATSIDLII